MPENFSDAKSSQKLNRIYIACGNGRDKGCGEINECLEGFQCVCSECGRTLRDGREEEPLEVFC